MTFNKITSILFLLCVVLPIGTFAQGFDESVNWQKTLRIRGIIQDVDPFNETRLYRLSEMEPDSIEIDRRHSQFEMVASRFWKVLRDSLKNAIRDRRVSVYIPQEMRERRFIYEKGPKVTSYDIVLDSLNTVLQRVSDREPNDNIYLSDAMYNAINLRTVQTESFSSLQQNMDDLGVDIFDTALNMYELEVVLTVDETGFKIDPISLIFGSAHLTDNQVFQLQGNATIDDVGYFDRLGYNFGVFLDLKEEDTFNYLIESGIKTTGEKNMIPFYNLITMFHYDYTIYSESNNVVNEATNLGYDPQELQKLLLNKYNETTYNYLYGQAPQWWINGEKGNFTNGMYEYNQKK